MPSCRSSPTELIALVLAVRPILNVALASTVVPTPAMVGVRELQHLRAKAAMGSEPR